MDLSRFSDRLEPATYADDEPVAIFETSHDEPDALWIPARLLWRLVHVA